MDKNKMALDEALSEMNKAYLAKCAEVVKGYEVACASKTAKYFRSLKKEAKAKAKGFVGA